MEEELDKEKILNKIQGKEFGNPYMDEWVKGVKIVEVGAHLSKLPLVIG